MSIRVGGAVLFATPCFCPGRSVLALAGEVIERPPILLRCMSPLALRDILHRHAFSVAFDPERSCTKCRNCVAAFGPECDYGRDVLLSASRPQALNEERMDRREFIAGTAALLALPRRSWAQGTPRRIGYLDSAPLYLPNFKVWQDSLLDRREEPDR